VTRISIASLLIAATLFLTGGASALATENSLGLGQRIYREGTLATGQPVQAEREPGMPIAGASAACVNCHRRSGLGMKEGRTSIPPIAGIYLYHPRAGTMDDLDLPFVEGMRADRDPYTDATLARAIRTGIGADGKPLSYLMPHYTLNDEQMAGLIAYLKDLSPGHVPGVTDSLLHFATIVTPDAISAERQGVLDVLEKFFLDKNHYVRAESPRLRSSHRMMFKVNRPWRLHVWELTGAAETWETQLRAHLSAEPVFAVISGVGGSNWAPIHRFCEAQSLPCLFPNLDLPATGERDFDSLYLSKGVLLEAQLLAREIREQQGTAPAHRVLQVFRDGDVGQQAAMELDRSLAGQGLEVINLRLAKGGDGRSLVEALRAARAKDALVLWLRPEDVAALGPVPLEPASVLISGRMAGLESAPLPAAWRSIARMAYPFDLPEQRRVRVDYPLGWFSIRKIPVVSQQAQTDTWLACGIVSDAINHMADTFVRDYLVERIEEMLEHRVITGYYPRLALAPGQRFASKGGYIVRFAEPTGRKLMALTDWITP
jgi:hypothetical protein